MKILCQRVGGATSTEHPQVLDFSNLLRKNFELVKSSDTQIDFQIPQKGITHYEGFYYKSINFYGDREVLEGVLRAEQDGYDAVMLCCFADPVLREARQLVNIPVVGPAEASMLMACMMGLKFGVITASPQNAIDVQESIKIHGLSERATLVKYIPCTAREQVQAVNDAHHEINVFCTIAKEVINEGAEILIPGCMLLAPVVRMAPGCTEYPEGLKEVEGVPVMDVVGVMVKITELLVSLKNSGSAWISRKGFYSQPNERALRNLTNFLYNGPGFLKD